LFEAFFLTNAKKPHTLKKTAIAKPGNFPLTSRPLLARSLRPTGNRKEVRLLSPRDFI
jgi:hypothetical protein